MIYILLGFVTGIIGTLIGVGGGFIIVPVLMSLLPDANHDRITAISMAVVAFNATSGSITYVLRKRVHLRAGFVFIAMSLPGAVLGVWAGGLVSKTTFQLIFGIVLGLLSILLFFKAPKKSVGEELHSRSKLPLHVYIFGALASFLVASFASFLGIGGGIIHVPLLSHVIGFPVHLATGTSLFILAMTGWTATIEHLRLGNISLLEPLILQLIIGVVLGAQVGAYLSPKVPGRLILKILGAVLFVLGIRLIMRAL